MIARIIAVDPRPEPSRSDLLVYQVPENSREFAVLTESLEAAGIEWTSVRATPKPRFTCSQGLGCKDLLHCKSSAVCVVGG